MQDQHLTFGPIVWSANGRDTLIESQPGNILGVERLATIVIARPHAPLSSQEQPHFPKASDFYKLFKREKPVAFRATATVDGNDIVHLYTIYGSRFGLQ